MYSLAGALLTTKGGFWAFRLGLSLNEMNEIGLSVSMFLCGYEMETFWKHFKIVKCLYKLGRNNLKEETGHVAEVEWDVSLLHKVWEQKGVMGNNKLKRETSSIKQGTVFTNAWYERCYLH